jgi:hypothetical protein
MVETHRLCVPTLLVVHQQLLARDEFLAEVRVRLE